MLRISRAPELTNLPGPVSVMISREGDPVDLPPWSPVLVAPLHPPPGLRQPAGLGPGHPGVCREPEHGEDCQDLLISCLAHLNLYDPSLFLLSTQPSWQSKIIIRVVFQTFTSVGGPGAGDQSAWQGSRQEHGLGEGGEELRGGRHGHPNQGGQGVSGHEVRLAVDLVADLGRADHDAGQEEGGGQEGGGGLLGHDGSLS